MSDCIRIFEIAIRRDELGEFEELSWDLVPLVDPKETLHLEPNGLPAVGTSVVPGMVLVGKIGKSKSYPTSRKPTSLELNALSFDNLRRQFGGLWVDRAFRVPEGCFGEVAEAKMSAQDDGTPVAVIKLRIS